MKNEKQINELYKALKEYEVLESFLRDYHIYTDLNVSYMLGGEKHTLSIKNENLKRQIIQILKEKENFYRNQIENVKIEPIDFEDIPFD